MTLGTIAKQPHKKRNTTYTPKCTYHRFHKIQRPNNRINTKSTNTESTNKQKSLSQTQFGTLSVIYLVQSFEDLNMIPSCGSDSPSSN